MADRFVSLGAAKHAAARFRDLFKGDYARWETCDYVRRREAEEPMRLVHVVIPQAAPAGSIWENAVWDRSVHLAKTLACKPASGMTRRTPTTASGK